MDADLATAHDAEKGQLSARIAELESQIANPEASFAQMQTRIRDLEALLDREGNEIGGDRLAEARAALEQGDFSLADDIFAEIEARDEIAVQRSARATFGRGEIAESETRWLDAARHYQKAARLDPCYRTLSKAHEFTHWSGDYALAEKLGEQNIEAAEAEGDTANLAMAKNDQGLTQYVLGRFAVAEALFLEALDLDSVSIGERHADYATHLNSLANAVRAQGRYKEAEDLYHQALKIDAATIGTQHQDYAIDLNNLASAVRAQGRYVEA